MLAEAATSAANAAQSALKPVDKVDYKCTPVRAVVNLVEDCRLV